MKNVSREIVKGSSDRESKYNGPGPRKGKNTLKVLENSIIDESSGKEEDSFNFKAKACSLKYEDRERERLRPWLMS